MMKGRHIAEFFIDAGVSGSVRFADRLEGKRLLETAGKGDVVITAKLDRAFRNAADALATLERNIGVGFMRSRPKPGRPSRILSKPSPPPRTPTDR